MDQVIKELQTKVVEVNTHIITCDRCGKELYRSVAHEDGWYNDRPAELSIKLDISYQGDEVSYQCIGDSRRYLLSQHLCQECYSKFLDEVQSLVERYGLR